MRRLGETASDVTGGWYSPKSTIPRRGGNRNGGRLLTPSGEIECRANFTRDTATDSLPLLVTFFSFSLFQLSFFFALRFSTIRFVRTKRMPFFPVVSANRGIGSPSNGYSVSPMFVFFFLPFFLSAFTSFLSAMRLLRILFLLLAPLS